MSEYVIEENIPLPKKKMSGRWDFVLEMTKGQRFVVQREHHGAVRSFAHRNNIVIASREINSTEIRIWNMVDKIEQ